MSSVNPEWILVTGAGILLFSLFEAWIATLIVYGQVQWLKRLFPATRNLILSHVDYTIMVGLAGFSYFAVKELSIELPGWVIVTLCAGLIYNPLGFFFKAINPKLGHDGSLQTKLGVMIGFLPATIGFGYIMIAIFDKTINMA